MTEHTEYLAGKLAFSSDLQQEDNPHYKCFGKLPQEYHEWYRGWKDAGDEQYAYWDDCESQEWQDYSNEVDRNSDAR